MPNSRTIHKRHKLHQKPLNMNISNFGWFSIMISIISISIAISEFAPK